MENRKMLGWGGLGLSTNSTDEEFETTKSHFDVPEGRNEELYGYFESRVVTCMDGRYNRRRDCREHPLHQSSVKKTLLTVNIETNDNGGSFYARIGCWKADASTMHGRS